MSQQAASQLRQVLLAAEQEDWVQVANLTPQVTAVLDLFRTIPASSREGTANLGSLREILQMLQKASTLCSVRKEQIAPLVGSLKKMQTLADEP